MNLNPKICESNIPRCKEKLDPENLTKEMVFELVRYIKDPEHPYSLETLNVVNIDSISIDSIKTKFGDDLRQINVLFQPTIPHCLVAAIIGLSIFYVLNICLNNFWIRIQIVKDSHVNWKMINKQLDDKDRINGALENESILNVIHECIPNDKIIND